MSAQAQPSLPLVPAAPHVAEPLLHLQHPTMGTGWFHFTAPQKIMTAQTHAEVMPLLEEVEAATQRGLYAVGFLCYEAAPAFDPALKVHDPGDLPLAWFGLYENPQPVAMQPAPGRFPALAWAPSTSPDEYRAAMHRIRGLIAAGETYQVNYTFRLLAETDANPFLLFQGLEQQQPGGYAAYLDLGDHVICSVSPELFFQKEGRNILCRPMKGTSPRGRTAREDTELRNSLHHSGKNRAENIMIVDMMRNDLGRIAVPGSVQVDSLFDVRTYPTVLQMTSTVSAQTHVALPDLFRALFPCASITGAPKVRTMQIIADTEDTPRGVYCGAIGVAGPGGTAQFNVAIRTVHIDRRVGRATYGTGGGIVWDSDADTEYTECGTKALVLQAGRPAFKLLETLRWDPETGFLFLEEHVARLRDSAQYFDFVFDESALRSRVERISLTFHGVPQRVRVLLSPCGGCDIEDWPLPDTRFVDDPDETAYSWLVPVAACAVKRTDPFLYHKTTHREVYDTHLRAHPDANDVVLWNEAGEVTETCIGNVVIRRGGKWLSPPVECGLLAGTYRAVLLRDGRIHEAIIPRAELYDADAIYMINSVRGWVRLQVESREP